MSKEKDMHKTGWKNIDLPPHLKKAREEQKEYKYLQELAYEINPESIINDATYQDFVDHEQNLVEMVDFLKENKDVDGVFYTEDVIELANFIKSTQSTDYY